MYSHCSLLDPWNNTSVCVFPMIDWFWWIATKKWFDLFMFWGHLRYVCSYLYVHCTYLSSSELSLTYNVVVTFKIFRRKMKNNLMKLKYVLFTKSFSKGQFILMFSIIAFMVLKSLSRNNMRSMFFKFYFLLN